jgi:hypothetical protein
MRAASATRCIGAATTHESWLFEQWRDQAVLDAHLARLRRVYGPADEQAAEPPRRRVPKAVLAPFEQVEAVRYEPLA